MATGYRPVRGLPGKGNRSAPYFTPPSESGAQQQAIDDLLGAVAQKAATMSLEDIVALTAAFSEPDGDQGAGHRTGVVVPPPIYNVSPGAPATVSHAIHAAMEQRGGAGREDSTPMPQMDEIVGALQTVKVSTKANVKSIAGSVSKALRNSEAFVASAVGAEGINHCMKAIAIARYYLAAEGLDLTATVCEVQREDGSMRDKSSLEGRVFAVTVWRKFVPAQVNAMSPAGVGRTEPLERFVRPSGCQMELKVAGTGLATTLAGAVAKALRDDKEVLVTAVGPQAVAKALEAIALSRLYVQQDGVALAFYPEFHQVTMQQGFSGLDEVRSGLRLHAWSDNGLG